MPFANPTIYYYDNVEIKPWTYQLAVSNAGLVFVGLKDDNTFSSIYTFYPNQMLIQDSKRVEPYAQQLREYFAGKRKKFTLPIDYGTFGTPFQNKVVQMVEKIPYGSTMTYGDLAAAINGSTSVRAVAHAVALNPTLIFIPSHRVVLNNKKVGSYRMGEKEKLRLINLEKGYLNADYKAL